MTSPTLLALALAVQLATPPASDPAASDTAASDTAASDTAASDTAASEVQAGEAQAGETIVARKKDVKRLAGSAHLLDEETLERFEPDDVQRALRGVPGVYVRDEDGAGLRPNIGLRGASSDRSAKVALLEDGVLFAPAPYSAPAAYYFPLTTRMVGIEVFKGPAAIRQGPHTVGGALNMRTRPVPVAPAASLDAGVGLVGFDREQARMHGTAGAGDEHWGVLVEGARVQSDGFKHLPDPNAPTGFVRDDVMLKARVGSGLFDDVRHGLELKLGFQREESHETYLGLSDVDFRKDGLQRYAASANDHMAWARTQGQLRYTLAFDVAPGAETSLDVVAYRHDLDRTWNKVNGVRGSAGLHDVLTFADAGSFPLALALLRGDEDADPDGAILIGPNHRVFFSHGVAATGRARFTLGPVEQRLEAGVRLHQDGVKRRHTERAFHLVRGTLVDRGEPEVVTAVNEASALAFAAHVADEVRFGDVAVVPGVRMELIRGTFASALVPGAPAVVNDQMAFLPGVGVAWQPLPALVLLAGVHRGFSPIAPGQAANVRPEESTNAELGARVDVRRALGLSGEVIGFWSQYDNILGECTFSTGCVDDIGTQQNGGTALIAGVEAVLRHELPLTRVFGEGAMLRGEASYTFTHATFLTTFSSSHPLFARVAAGDEMAYVPAHQAAFTSALVLGDLDAGVSMGLVSAMRDVPGQGEAPAHELTDAQAVVDVAASYALFPGVRIAVRADNVLDQRAIVSRRPFGARPGKPRSVLLSLELETP